MVRELLINSDEIEEDSRLGMLGEIAEQCEEIGDNYFMRFEWFVDEAMPLLCGDDEKAYLAHISKRLKTRKRNTSTIAITSKRRITGQRMVSVERQRS